MVRYRRAAGQGILHPLPIFFVRIACVDLFFWHVLQVGRPMLHDRGQTINPYGPTLLYGYDHAVFEVAKASGYITSVVLF